jgi:hypothetical protein
VWWLIPVIPTTGEVEIRRIVVHKLQKVARPASQSINLGVVACTCDPSYMEV